MRYFLSDQRRLKLIDDLMALTAPRPLAEQFANFRDDVEYVDRCLAFMVRGLSLRCSSLARAARCGNEGRARDLRAYLRADVAIIRAYTAEIDERGIPRQRFPRSTIAMNVGIKTTDSCRELILAAIGKGERPLH